MTWDLGHRNPKRLTVTYQLSVCGHPPVTDFVNLSLPTIPWGGEWALFCILQRACGVEEKFRSSSYSKQSWEKQPTLQSLKSVTLFLLCLPLAYMRSLSLSYLCWMSLVFPPPVVLHVGSLQVTSLLKYHEWCSISYWIKFKLLLGLIYIGIKISLTSYKPQREPSIPGSLWIHRPQRLLLISADLSSFHS